MGRSAPHPTTPLFVALRRPHSVGLPCEASSVSIPSAVKSTPIAGRQQLADYLAAGEKPREAWRIGTEHEKFGFRTDDLRQASRGFSPAAR